MLLIDPPMWRAHGTRWSHLVSDASFAELHAFATAHGIPPGCFEGDHYDVPEGYYPALVASGAVPVSSRELLRRLQASGLRRPKRRGERVLGGRTDAQQGRRVDTVLSGLAPLTPVTRVHLVVRSGRQVLVLPDGEGFVLPTVTPAPGEDESAAALRLMTSLVGFGALPRRVGYMRTVALPKAPDRRSSQLHSEVVLEADAGAGAGQAAGSPVRWVADDEAAALLPLELSPLVHSPSASSAG